MKHERSQVTRVGRKSRRLFAGAFRHLPTTYGGRRDKAAFPPYSAIANARGIRKSEGAVGELAAQAVHHLRDAFHAFHPQHAVVDLHFDPVVAFARHRALIGQIALREALARLDGFHLLQPFLGLLELGEGDLLFQQCLALRTQPGIALDGAAHPFGGEAVGIVLAFHQDEAAAAVVAGVGFQHRVGGGAGAGEGVEDEGVRCGSNADNPIQQFHWLWCGEWGFFPTKNLSQLFLCPVAVIDLAVSPNGLRGN